MYNNEEGEWVFDARSTKEILKDKDYKYDKQELQELAELRQNEGFGGPYRGEYDGLGLAFNGVLALLFWIVGPFVYWVMVFIMFMFNESKPGEFMYLFTYDNLWEGNYMGLLILLVMFVLSLIGAFSIVGWLFCAGAEDLGEVLDKEYNLHLQIEADLKEQVASLEADVETMQKTEDEELANKKEELEALRKAYNKNESDLNKLKSTLEKKDIELTKKEASLATKDLTIAKLKTELHGRNVSGKGISDFLDSTDNE